MPELTDADILEFTTNILTIEETEAIVVALTTDDPWAHKDFDEPIKSLLVSVKNKIKAFHLERVSDSCCYCSRSLKDASIETDREHIVPKGEKKSLTYNIFNLSVACKRCNMTYKNTKTDHITNLDSIEANLKDPGSYLIPHPNIDTYSDHLKRVALKVDTHELTAYGRKTDKGRYLFDFVQLQMLCVDTLDVAQGGKSLDEAMALFFEKVTQDV